MRYLLQSSSFNPFTCRKTRSWVTNTASTERACAAISMITGQRVKAPEPLLKHYPELSKIADPIYDDTASPELPLRA